MLILWLLVCKHFFGTLRGYCYSATDVVLDDLDRLFHRSVGIETAYVAATATVSHRGLFKNLKWMVVFGTGLFRRQSSLVGLAGVQRRLFVLVFFDRRLSIAVGSRPPGLIRVHDSTKHRKLFTRK